MRRLVALGVAVGALGVVLAREAMAPMRRWRRAREVPGPEPAIARPAPARAAARVILAVEDGEAPRPLSLMGTRVDGDLVAAGGALVAGPEAVRLFDYFLAALGETDMDGVRALVAAEARRRVPGQEAAVGALFERYVGYLEGAALVGRSAPAGTPLRGYLDRLEALQVERFGAAAAARLFGDDNALARVIVEEAELGVRHLAAAELDAHVAAIEARLPPRLRAARERVRAPARVRAEVEELRRRGAGTDQIWALRAHSFGADAADRLAALDQQRGR